MFIKKTLNEKANVYAFIIKENTFICSKQEDL